MQYIQPSSMQRKKRAVLPDELYDHGKIIFQKSCSINEEDTPETLAKKIHALEHEFYPGKIEEVIKNLDK